MYKQLASLPKTAGRHPEYGPIRGIRTDKGKLIRDWVAVVDEWRADEFVDGFVPSACNSFHEMINLAAASVLPNKPDVIRVCCSAENTVPPAHQECRHIIFSGILNWLAEVTRWENQR